MFFQANHRDIINIIPTLSTRAKVPMGHMAFQGCEGLIDSRVCSVVILPQPILSFKEQHRVEEPLL